MVNGKVDGGGGWMGDGVGEVGRIDEEESGLVVGR
jgi:hypothetical protein